ncbi:MAG: ATP-binding protein [Nitrospirota bacterium]
MERSPSRTRTRWGLKGRLVLLTLVVGTVPLLLAIGMAYVQGTRELQTVIGASFAGLATESARKLDLVFADEVTLITRIARDPALVEFLTDRAAAPFSLADPGRRWQARDDRLVREITEGPLAGRLKWYLNNEAHEPDATRVLFVTDAAGRLAGSVNTSVDYTHGGETWWQKALAVGRGGAYLGNVTFDPALNAYTFHLSVPVMGSDRKRPLGVVHRVFDAKSYLSPFLSPIRFGKTGHVMLIDSSGTVMSCPILPTGTRLADAELVRLVTPPHAGWAKTPSDGHGSQTQSIVGFSPLSDTNRLTIASTGTVWHTFAWQSSGELLAPTRHLLARTSVGGLLAIALLAVLGYAAAVRIVTPIRRLQQGAALIGRGELNERISVRTGDEIEQLAEEFDRMNVRLRKAFSGLTQEVEEKAEEIRSLQAYTQRILDSVPNPIVLIEDERVQYANFAARCAFGVGDREVHGTNLFELIPLDDSSRERLRDQLHVYAQGLAMSGRTPGPVQVSGADEPPGDPLSPRPTSETSPATNELTIRRVTYRYEMFRIDTRSTEQGWAGLVLWDTTGESQMQDQLLQAEKLAGLGVLTSGIGHELNNPLFGILSLSEAIRDEKDPTRMKDHASRIVDHAKRMARVIRDFAGSTRPDRADLRDDVDVNEQLDLALRVVGLTDEVTGLQVRRRYQSVPRIRAVPEEIGQVFVSVITNAIQAMKGRGTIDLSSGVSSEAIVVRIHDSGPGVPKGYASKIFDPFFTTKAPGQGTGLGLTIARRIVLRYGGQIRLEPGEGPGATFVLRFPTT